MKIIKSVSAMQRHSRKLASEGKRIGLVPTMGYLHKGHQSLIKQAAKLCDTVITTIFVNPTQFAPGEDLEKYPRDEKEDTTKIEVTLGKKADSSVLYLAKTEEMYPGDFETWVTVEKLAVALEGKKRPNHFRGVTTIVAKLFNITRPDVALFGMKDYQQAVVLKKMCADLNYPIKIVIAPTVREPDGLAMSSRNAYLDEIGRSEAICLYGALQTAQEMVARGIRGVSLIQDEMLRVISVAAPSAHVDYVAFTDGETLKPVETVAPGTICSLAVFVHKVRLIDNMKLL